MSKQVLTDFFDLNKDIASMPEISERIIAGGVLKGTNMCILILAIFIASIGLNMNSTAVIIGAMLISPLMGVIMSLGYGMASYDSGYVKESFLKLMFQVILSVAASAVYFSLSPIDTASSELLARTEPTIWDVLIAVFGGFAGIIGNTRAEKSNVIPGVAIATALMPPLCTAGYGLANGEWKFFFGALYLFFINSFFICLTAFVFFKIIRIPAKSYVSDKIFKQQRLYLTVLGIIIILPSLYMAYQSVRNNLEQAQIKSYISTAFDGSDMQVVSYKMDAENKRLTMTLIGRTIDDSEQKILTDKLQAYSQLTGYSLHLIQNDLSAAVKADDVKNLIDSQWQSVGGSALKNTEEELKKYQEKSLLYAPAYQRAQEEKRILDSVREKAPAVIQQFAGIEGASIPADDGDGNIVYREFLAIVYVNAPLTPEDTARLQKWLNLEANMTVKFTVQLLP